MTAITLQHSDCASPLPENGDALDAIALRSERAHAATDMLIAYLERIDERIAFPDIHPGTFKSLLLGVMHELDEISDLTTAKPRSENNASGTRVDGDEGP